MSTDAGSVLTSEVIHEWSELYSVRKSVPLITIFDQYPGNIDSDCHILCHQESV